MYFNFGQYVSVEKQRKKAEKEICKLRREGFDPQPVEAFRGKVAKTFWGVRWCENLETYADMAYRAERGRRYVRTGSICHIAVGEGHVEGIVSGSRLYRVKIDIQLMNADSWKEICAKCACDIGSLVDLLKGQLSKNVMEIVTSQESGLFPAPSQISFSCSCPDSASMCKHVAAILYGVGRRLDEMPELLFKLRGVNPQELLRVDFNSPEAELTSGMDNLSEIFGIDLDLGETPLGGPGANAPERDNSQGQAASFMPDTPALNASDTEAENSTKGDILPVGKIAPEKRRSQPRRPFNPAKPSGRGIRLLRKMSGLSQMDFAAKVGVTLGTLRRWEDAPKISPQSGSIKKLLEFQNRLFDGVQK